MPATVRGFKAQPEDDAAWLEVRAYLKAFHSDDAAGREEVLATTITILARQGREEKAIRAALARIAYLWMREHVITLRNKSYNESEARREKARKDIARALRSVETHFEAGDHSLDEDEMREFLTMLRGLLERLQPLSPDDPDFGKYFVSASDFRRSKAGRPWSYRTEGHKLLKRLRVPEEERKALLAALFE
jgi:hypothetical protein